MEEVGRLKGRDKEGYGEGGGVKVQGEQEGYWYMVVVSG